MMLRFYAFGGILGLYVDDLRFRIKSGPASFQFLDYVTLGLVILFFPY